MSVAYDTAVAIIDDEVHKACEYPSYSRLRDAVDALENENDELREIIGELFDDLLFSCGECWLSGDVRTCDNEGCDNYKTYQKICALEIEVPNE